MSKYPIYWLRASSMSELFDCPARWEAKHIDGIKMPSSASAHIGTSIHASTAVFDESYISGTGLTANDALAVFVDSLHDKNVDVDWKEDDMKIDVAEQIGSALHTNYCDIITPTQDYQKVEVECKPLLIEFDDIGVALNITGSTDRVRKTEKGLGISDLKTGKMAVKADGTVDVAKHGAQLGIYEILVENETGESITAPAQIVGLQTNSKARVGKAELTTAKSVLLGGQGEVGMLEQAATLIKSGAFYGNNRSMLCHEKYCPIFNKCKWRF
jgi:hypothetical protein